MSRQLKTPKHWALLSEYVATGSKMTRKGWWLRQCVCDKGSVMGCEGGKLRREAASQAQHRQEERVMAWCKEGEQGRRSLEYVLVSAQC